MDEENEDECNKSKVKRKYEIDNDDCVDVTDEEYEIEVNEFNVWYSKKLKERRHLKVDECFQSFICIHQYLATGTLHRNTPILIKNYSEIDTSSVGNRGFI